MSLVALKNRNSHGGLPVIAKLRKGAPKGANGVGKDLDYFRFVASPNPTTPEDRQLAEAFRQAFGDKPRAVEFYLAEATADDAFDPCREHRVKTALQHRCDGQTCSLWLKKDGTYSTEPIPCPGECTWKGNLHIIIPELKRPAAVKLVTGSFWDCLNIYDNLQAIERMFGTLLGVKMIVRRVETEVSTPEIKNGVRTGKKFLTKKWLLTIEASQESWEKRLAALAQAALPSQPARLEITTSLPPDADIDADDDDDHGDSHAEIEQAIFAIWTSSGKPAADFMKYRQQTLAPMTLEQKQAKLQELQKATIGKQVKAASAGASSELQVIDAELVGEEM